MAGLGTSVFAFDCTDKNRAEWNSFTFHRWCLGRPASFEDNVYSKRAENQTFEFYSLSEIRHKLGHKKIDMFKMDIEGFEWEILKSEIIEGHDDDLPEQLLFELHTQGSSPKAVPPKLVEGKTRHEVNQLIYQLHSRGS